MRDINDCTLNIIIIEEEREINIQRQGEKENNFKLQSTLTKR